MPQWLVKAAIQGVLARLPQTQRWNRLLQKHVTRSLDLHEPEFLGKWQQSRRHVENFGRFAIGEARTRLDAGFTALEIGTGWFPIVPIGLVLNGAERVYSVDMQDLLAHERVVLTLERYASSIQSGAIEPRRTNALEQVKDVLQMASRLSAREMLGVLGVQSMVGDARQLELSSETIDLLCSNNTLEHIPRQVIVDIFKDFSRLLRTGGIMSHFIDLADHYADFDKRITVYNFLKFSEQVWPLFNNDLLYQNRLRVSDFREIHRETAWQVLDESNQSKPLEVLRSIRLAPQFRRYDAEDLAVFATWMVSRPASHA